jgi:hypothetical protein
MFLKESVGLMYGISEIPTVSSRVAFLGTVDALAETVDNLALSTIIRRGFLQKIALFMLDI